MKKFELSIPKPCKESWQEMNPGEQGRFCQHCSKTVIDFTAFYEAQVLQFFQQDTGSVCGRFQAQQLKGYHQLNQPAIATPPLKLFVALGLSFATVTASGQNTNTKQVQQAGALHPAQPIDTVVSSAQAYPTKQVFKIVGQVWAADDQAAPLPGVSVFIKGTSRGTLTDAKGNFEFSFEEKPLEPVELRFSFIGYQMQEIQIDFEQQPVVNVGKVILFLDQNMLIGEVVVVHTNPASRLWWNMKGLFNRIF